MNKLCCSLYEVFFGCHMLRCKAEPPCSQRGGVANASELLLAFEYPMFHCHADVCCACCAGEAAAAGELLLVLAERINSSANAVA